MLVSRKLQHAAELGFAEYKVSLPVGQVGNLPPRHGQHFLAVRALKRAA